MTSAAFEQCRSDDRRGCHEALSDYRKLAPTPLQLEPVPTPVTETFLTIPDSGHVGQHLVFRMSLSTKSSIIENYYFDTDSCYCAFLLQKVGVHLVEKVADASVIMKRHRGPNIDTSTRSPSFL